MKVCFSLIILSFILIVSSCGKKNTNQIIVAIQPYETIDQSVVDTVKNAIEMYYGFKVSVLGANKLPKTAFTTLKTPRYRADSLIRFQKNEKHDSIDYVIGLTDQDISCTKYDLNGEIKAPKATYQDWGIFGLGYKPGCSSIVSTFRLKKSINKNQFIDRIKKVALHELGHNLGLPHCKSSAKCFMKDAAESIRTIDEEELDMCSSCKRKI